MTLDQIRKYTNALADKHRSGKTITEDQFNQFIDVVNIEMFNDEYNLIKAQAAERSIPMNIALWEADTLREFKVYDASIALTSGLGNLPDDYRYYMGLSDSETGKFVDIISDLEFTRVKSNIFYTDANISPMGVIYGTKFRMVPASASEVLLNYLKNPVVPYYDFCIKTATRAIVYMPPGSVIQDGDLKTATNGNVLETDVTHLEDRVVSLSVELEWHDESHPDFADRLLIKMGISLKDEKLYEMAKIEKQG